MTTLTLMVGLPGSGKSTYTKTKIDARTKILASDAIRKELYGFEEDQDHNDEVFNTLYSRARNFLSQGKDVLIDATNSSIENRKKALSHFEDLKIRRRAIVIENSVETCIKQDSLRRRVVGEKVIREFAENFSYPTREEGFDEIIIIKSTDDGFVRYLKTTLLFIIKDNKILLAKKKRGFGAGLLNGAGGKVEPYESVEDAAIRETQEEFNIRPINPQKRAEIEFDEYVKGEHAIVNMSIFTATDYEGTPTESEEMAPVWFDLDKIPYTRMFPDDGYWLPEILKGNYVTGTFKYDINLNILEHSIETNPNK